MKKFVLLLGVLALAGCVSSQQMVASQTNQPACLPSTGQTFSYLNQTCVQVFNIADIKLVDPHNPDLAVYVILSDDKDQAEMFWASFDKPILMDSVKGGYLSKDSKVRLMNDNGVWKIRQ